MNAVLETLTKAGVSIWLDDLTRTRITTGNLKELIDTMSVRGVTTNPSILKEQLPAVQMLTLSRLQPLHKVGLTPNRRFG